LPKRNKCKRKDQKNHKSSKQATKHPSNSNSLLLKLGANRPLTSARKRTKFKTDWLRWRLVPLRHRSIKADAKHLLTSKIRESESRIKPRTKYWIKAMAPATCLSSKRKQLSYIWLSMSACETLKTVKCWANAWLSSKKCLRVQKTHLERTSRFSQT
jgi:hypothetical protein